MREGLSLLRRALVVAFIVVGCSHSSGYQPISAPGGRVQIAEDASVAPPAGEGWMMQRTPHETGEEVLFGRDLTAKPTRAEDDHTLRVEFSVQRAIGAAAHDQAFRYFGLRKQRDTEGGRLTNISYTSTRNDFGGADCLRYQASTEDRGVPAFPGSVFTLTNDGMLCFHPLRPVAVIVDWSERFLAGQTAVAPPPQVDEFLESLRFLGKPQAIAAAAPPALAGPVLLSDRFSSAGQWLTADNEYLRAEFASDGYAVEFKRDDAGIFRTSAPGSLEQNVRIEAAVIAPRVRGTRAQWYGIICSAQLDKAFALYHLLVSPDGDYEIAKVISGTDNWSVLAIGIGWIPGAGRADPIILQGDCVTKGQSTWIVFRANGETLLSVQDDDPHSVGRPSQPGLYAQGGVGFRVTYRSVEIRLLS